MLGLGGNQIGDNGMKAFAVAIGNGALPMLRELFLCHNNIGHDGIKAFADALGKGGLPALKQLFVDVV